MVKKYIEVRVKKNIVTKDKDKDKKKKKKRKEKKRKNSWNLYPYKHIIVITTNHQTPETNHQKPKTKRSTPNIKHRIY